MQKMWCKMKTRSILFFLLAILIFIPITSLAQTQSNCHFGDDTTPDEAVLVNDLAVKVFLEKHPNAQRTNMIDFSDPIPGHLTYSIENQNEKIILSIEYTQNENGCYTPQTYQYSYDNGIIDVIIRNSMANFTEIVNLIKLDDKKIEDFHPINCNYIQLDYVLEGKSKPYFCKYDYNNSIQMSLQKHIGGIIEIHIPNKIMDALFYNCAVVDFSVLNNGEEILYESFVDKDQRIFKMDLPKGYSKMEIIGFTNLGGDPGFCGSIWSKDSRYISPLMQTKIGVEPWMVQCNEGLSLLLKPMESTSAVCVTDSTYEELASRGWSLVGIWNDENEN